MTKSCSLKQSVLRIAVSVVVGLALLFGAVPSLSSSFQQGGDGAAYAAAKAKVYVSGKYKVTVNRTAENLPESVNIVGEAKPIKKSVTVPATLKVKIGQKSYRLPVVRVKGIKTNAKAVINLKNLPDLKKVSLSDKQWIVFRCKGSWKYYRFSDYNVIDESLEPEVRPYNCLLKAQYDKKKKGLKIAAVAKVSAGIGAKIPATFAGQKVVKATIDHEWLRKHLRNQFFVIDDAYTAGTLTIKYTESNNGRPTYAYRGYTFLIMDQQSNGDELIPPELTGLFVLIDGQYDIVAKMAPAKLFGFRAVSRLRQEPEVIED